MIMLIFSNMSELATTKFLVILGGGREKKNYVETLPELSL